MHTHPHPPSTTHPLHPPPPPHPQLYHTEAVSAAAPAGALAAHARSKEHLLSLLSSRLLDKDSYVRQRTLHTWAGLVATPVVPLPMWNMLLNLGEGQPHLLVEPPCIMSWLSPLALTNQPSQNIKPATGVVHTPTDHHHHLSYTRLGVLWLLPVCPLCSPGPPGGWQHVQSTYLTHA
jgi:hypothetical protein